MQNLSPNFVSSLAHAVLWLIDEANKLSLRFGVGKKPRYPKIFFIGHGLSAGNLTSCYCFTLRFHSTSNFFYKNICENFTEFLRLIASIPTYGFLCIMTFLEGSVCVTINGWKRSLVRGRVKIRSLDASGRESLFGEQLLLESDSWIFLVVTQKRSLFGGPLCSA